MTKEDALNKWRHSLMVKEQMVERSTALLQRLQTELLQTGKVACLQ